jgi:hypothetical protein
LDSLVALDQQTHRNLRVVNNRVCPGHAAVNAVSVIPREFPWLLAHYPIFFTKNSETDHFEPAALFGFERGQNLFLKDGLWDAGYVPLQIQREPFSLIPRRGAASVEGQNTVDLAINLDSPQIQEHEGERLFLDDGKPTQYLQNIISMLSALVGGSKEAYAYTGRLAELKLIEQVGIEIEFADGTKTNLQGLHRISAASLKALTAAQLAELRDREYLEWMYFQMASLSHMPTLISRKNQLIARAAAAPG